MTRTQATERLIFVAGPFPPPVHGLAMVNELMANAVAQHAAVRKFDLVASRGHDSNLCSRLRLLLSTLPRLGWLLLRLKPDALIIGSSANAVMLFDAAVAVMASIAGVPAFIYHHSFAYLQPESTTWYHRVGMRMMLSCRHIVLCEHMANQLVLRHGIDTKGILKISNSAYIAPGLPRACTQSRDLTLGFLSSIQASKGIFEFLDLVDSLIQDGHRISAIIAGSPERGIADRFFERLALSAHSKYVGPVAGSYKAGFFSAVDMLVLPSRHMHEAEPLVVVESLSHSIPVLATKRGCLPSAWADGCAVHLVDEGSFVSQARTTMEPWLASDSVRAEWSRAAGEVHRRMHSLALVQFNSLVMTLFS